MTIAQNTQLCPICGTATFFSPRYPFHVCRECLGEGVMVNGEVCELRDLNVYTVSSIRCTVKGEACIAQEAHLGGTVVNLEKPHLAHIERLKKGIQ